MSFSSGSEGMHGSHAVFNRFWRHYEASMAWMRAHYATADRLNVEYAAQASRGGGSGRSVRQNSPRGPSDSKRRRCHITTSSERAAADADGDDCFSEEETTSNPESEAEDRIDEEVDDGGNPEERPTWPDGPMDGNGPDPIYEAADGEVISDEVLDFFETSRRHREQRDLEAAQRHYENLENLMISSRPLAMNAGAKTSAVFEAHQQEMKKLYGSLAATIHGMEMAMQCGFERFAQGDVKLWPNIPLRL
ncbi:gem-associated protein 8-like [Tropilaelaps mercedesae]|uniref:Gem-associated protein 8-like n=1 Tax=Tropilaelaps mercedesae TaxID=418985 RepID=A0A1V9XLX4_9ACAR|nr:gem-associated protein 8-like [Tropilaelaps mercedesae]